MDRWRTKANRKKKDGYIAIFPAAWVAGTIIVLLAWDLLRILNTIMKKR